MSLEKRSTKPFALTPADRARLRRAAQHVLAAADLAAKSSPRQVAPLLRRAAALYDLTGDADSARGAVAHADKAARVIRFHARRGEV
jgi:hypothetical protein